MKGIYIYYRDLDNVVLNGIDRKVLGQISTFRKHGLTVEVFIPDCSMRKLDKVFFRLPFSNVNPKWTLTNEIFTGIDFIYFRRPTAMNYHMTKFIKSIKKRNPNIKIIMELPTFPYDREISEKLKNIPLLIKDRVNRKMIHKIIDRIAIINNIEEVFNVKTLKINNAIDLDKVKLRDPKKMDDSINLIAVAMFEKWHGYDRVIRGLSNYVLSQSKPDVKLHLVGDGNEFSSYKKLVSDFSLEKYVVFHGYLSGTQLESLYDISDFGLDVFGMYRKNNYISYSLKSREYLAKGLPIITGCATDVFMKNPSLSKYFLVFENDNTTIDIRKIVDYYNNIYIKKDEHRELSRMIRNDSRQYISLENSMDDVIQYIKSVQTSYKNEGITFNDQ